MLILASASPRRRELLALAGRHFEVQAPPIEEQRRPGEDGISLATRLAREKAESVFALRSAAHDPSQPLLVLGADTVVVCGEEILGKPADAADAARMLRLLAGRTHQVITGVCLAAGGGLPAAVEIAASVTQVTVQSLSAEEIAVYIDTGEPMDKAGAYAIQGRAGRWIPRIQGCYFNVVGLPLSLVCDLLEGAERRPASPLQTC